MHELSIAMSMIDITTEEAAALGGGRVTALHLKLGPLSGVVKDALLFSYDVAACGTALEGSSLIIEEVPVVVFCRTCNQQRTIENNSTPGLSRLRRTDTGSRFRQGTTDSGNGD